jgi:hypothetical protein
LIEIECVPRFVAHERELDPSTGSQYTIKVHRTLIRGAKKKGWGILGIRYTNIK